MFYFVEKSKIANYVDDNTAYSVNDILEGLLKTLDNETSIILKWFHVNEMKSNEDNCHLFVVNTEEASVTIGNENLSACPSIELLGITIDNKLKFSEHISKLCKKGKQKLHALARVLRYLSRDKLKLLMKSFITSQFNYCPLIWMFHNRTLNNKINKLHEGLKEWVGDVGVEGGGVRGVGVFCFYIYGFRQLVSIRNMYIYIFSTL